MNNLSKEEIKHIEQKMAFGDTMLELNKNMPKGLSQCERYGMISGCDKYCPVLLEGKCELQEELKYLLEEENG